MSCQANVVDNLKSSFSRLNVESEERRRVHEDNQSVGVHPLCSNQEVVVTDDQVTTSMAVDSDQSASSSDQPASSSDQPASSSDQPASSSDQPASSSDQPASASDQPALIQPTFASDAVPDAENDDLEDDFLGSANYHSIAYWDKRYELVPEAFDWLQSYVDIGWAIDPLIPKTDSPILMIGCGNAAFSADMYDDGFTNIVNIDLSKQAIQVMTEEHSSIRPDLKFIQMDATNMGEFEDGSFDVVIDKGLMDTLVCYDNPEETISKMLHESCRVLRPGGYFVVISLHSSPETLDHFEHVLNSDVPWELATCKRIRNHQTDVEATNSEENASLGDGSAHTFVVMRRHGPNGEKIDYDAITAGNDGAEHLSYPKLMDMLQIDASEVRQAALKATDEEYAKMDIGQHVFSILSDDELSLGDCDDHRVEYGDIDYWNNRYENDSEPFDWLIEYQDFKRVLADRVELFQRDHKDAHILVAGCGNARFSCDMYDDGFWNQKNVDISSTVIELMRKEHEEQRPRMEWLVADITDLKPVYDDGSFDMVVDKSTLDCLFCRPNAAEEMDLFIKESFRVLKPGGVYVCISLHDSPKVLEIIDVLPWSTTWMPVANPRYEGEGDDRAKEYQVFICKKQAS